MCVIIDGVEYHKVLKSFYFDDGVMYAQIEPVQDLTASFNRIVDGDGDTWYPTGTEGRWSMRENSNREGETRETVQRLYRIAREYNA